MNTVYYHDSYQFTMHSVYLPYSGLFSLGANFPKFPKWADWAHNSGKFIMVCCIKFDGATEALGKSVIIKTIMSGFN